MTTTRVLAEGLYFAEGPRWHEGRLWFSGFYDHAVKSMDASGAIRTELEIDDQPSGHGVNARMPATSVLRWTMRSRPAASRA